MKLLLLLLCLCGSAAQASGQTPSIEEVARSAPWRRLLHYKNHWLGGASSSVSGEGFFLSPKGKYDAEAELRATLAALERGGGDFGKLQQPVNCAFPARKEFLEKAFDKKFPEEPCPDFADYHAKLDPGMVTLVFATSYPNNPASMFGHSFLKISKAASKGSVGLLDWSINYAAMVPEGENPFAFAYFGLFGGYQGQFSLLPYYAKIEEYGFLEGRDIWEYDLNLTQGEIETLVKAVWEVETNSHFLYYFADENCSYQVLAMLEVVKPEWNLSPYFIHMIPGESIKRVTNVAGAVKAVRMRPSLERRLRAVSGAMSKDEWRAFNQSRKTLDPVGLKGRSMQAYLLFLQAEKKRRGTKWSEAEEKSLRTSLSQRAGQAGVEEVNNFGGEASRPDLSHGAYQVGLGPVLEKQGDWKSGAELSLRMAYHDLLDADPGYMPHSEVLFPNLRLRYTERTKKFSVEEVEFMSLVSLTPLNLLRWPIAWRAKGNFERLLDLPCANCRALHGEGGAGGALALRPEKWTVWSLLGGEADISGSLAGKVRAAPWVELGTLFTLPTEGKILWESRLVKGFGRGENLRLDFHVGLSHPFSQVWGARAEGRAVYLLDSGATRTDIRFLALHYF